MAGKKGWRTVVKGDSTGRFTREQIRDAVDSVASKTNGRSSSTNDDRSSAGNSAGSGASRGGSSTNGRGNRT
jgi:hypothetical protein